MVERTVKEWREENWPEEDYFGDVDSKAYREGNSSYIERDNPYEPETQEWIDWNKGYHDADVGWNDVMSNDWY